MTLQPEFAAQAAVLDALAAKSPDERAAFLQDLASEQRARGKDIRVDYRAGAPVEFISGDRKIILSQKNFFYALDIVPHFDYYFSNVVPRQIGGMQVADFSRPGWHTLPGTDQEFYFSGMPEGRTEAQLYLDYLHPKEGETVIDLGAYCGLSAITFAEAVGRGGRVVSFEPDPDNYKALAMNLGAGNFPNVTPVNKAVWGTPRSLWFSSEGNMGSRVIDNPGHNRDKLVEVEGTTLPAIAAEHGLSRVDIVKMDIEGGEYDVLDHSTDFIKSTKARWFCEVHADPTNENRPNIARVRRVFDLCDYMTVQVSHGPGEFLFDLIYAEPR